MFSTALLLFPIKISRCVIPKVEDMFNPRVFGLFLEWYTFVLIWLTISVEQSSWNTKNFRMHTTFTSSIITKQWIQTIQLKLDMFLVLWAFCSNSISSLFIIRILYEKVEWIFISWKVNTIECWIVVQCHCKRYSRVQSSSWLKSTEWMSTIYCYKFYVQFFFIIIPRPEAKTIVHYVKCERSVCLWEWLLLYNCILYMVDTGRMAKSPCELLK